MNIKRALLSGVALMQALRASSLCRRRSSAPRTRSPLTRDDIGGVVTGPAGPEAGVWVIAETTDLGTKMAKMVVTDDQGRYVLPDLPKAKYKVWVRGYGLVDSPKVDSEPGKQLNLTAVKAPSEAAAAEYYPAIYWYSMVKVPGADQFPGTGPHGQWHQSADQDARASISTSSRPTAASAAISWATRRPARSRLRLAISPPVMKHGRGASSPARLRPPWSPTWSGWAPRPV